MANTTPPAAVAAAGPADEPLLLVLLGSPRYWGLCRKREAQKGAAWIKEMERLAREIEIEVGVGVRYLSLHLEGEPGWTYDEKGPLISGTPRLGPAWEYGAGRVKPRAKPRPHHRPATRPGSPTAGSRRRAEATSAPE